jgi:hypothetical protein
MEVSHERTCKSRSEYVGTTDVHLPSMTHRSDPSSSILSRIEKLSYKKTPKQGPNLLIQRCIMIP